MGKLPNASDSDTVPEDSPSESTTLMLIATMADTTWRMFVPTVALLLLGNWCDDRLHTTPWLMLTGAVLGGILAWWLIKRQMKRGKKA